MPPRPYTITEPLLLIDNVTGYEDCNSILEYMFEHHDIYPKSEFDEVMDNLNAIISVLNLANGII